MKKGVAIVTGVYPPMIGGVGAGMHSLAVRAPDQIAIITGEFDGDGRRIRSGGQRPSAPDRVYTVHRLSRNLNWLPGGKFRAVTQAAYDRLVVHPRANRELIRVLESIQPEIICVGTLSTCYWAVPALLKWRRNAKILVYVHGEEVPRGKGYFNYLRLRALQKATALLAVSSFTKSSLIDAGISPDRVTVLSSGVDTARFKPGERSQRIIDRYGLANRHVLMTLARLDERKGQDMVIRAMPTILAAVPDAVYLIVGEGGYGERLRSLVSELRLGNAVVFAGAVADEEVAEFYSTCEST